MSTRFLRSFGRLFVAVAIYSAAPARAADDAASRAHLKDLVASIRAYGIQNGDKLPARLSDVLDQGLADGPQSFVNPAGTTPLPRRAEVDEKGDYTMEPAASAPDALVREKKSTHTPGKILAGFKDGSIKLVDAPVEPAEVRPAPAAPVVPVAPVQPRTEPAPMRPVLPVTPIAPVTPALPVTPIAPVPPPAVVAPTETTRRLPEDLVRDGGALLAGGRVAEARDRFKEALTMQPESAEALKGLAQSQNLLGEIDAALATYRILARVAPATPNLRTWQAELAIAKSELAEARSLLDAELKAQPRSAWAMSWLGTLELESGNPAAARRHLQLAAQLDAAVVGQRQANMQWLGASNQPSRVLRESQAVLQMIANHAGAIFAEADSRAKLGQPREAIAAYERYLRIDAASEWAAKARAEIARLKAIRAN